MQIPVGPWMPDLPEFENPGSLEARNVTPLANSYGPWASLAETTGAMTARTQGLFSCRDSAGGVHNFAGDASKLYKLDGSTLNWTNVSRGAGYTTNADDGWSFAQFGDLVIAANGNDPVQSYNLISSTVFADAAGSPPVSRFVATVRDFVFLGRAGDTNLVRWSAINNAADYVINPGVTQADEQLLPDGGAIMGIVGGEVALVFQERSIRRFAYLGGDVIFQVDEIGRGIGTPTEGSLAVYQGSVFFLSDEGFQLLPNGGVVPTPIGNSRVDKTFLADLDQAYLYRVTAAIDPVNKLYVVSYPGQGSVNGAPNKLLAFNFSSDVNRWARGDEAVDMIFTVLQQANYTLETLDNFSSSIDALPFSLDSRVWTGAGRILLGGVSPAHKLGFFNGQTKAAVVDTTESQVSQGRALVTRVRPIVTNGTVSIIPGVRNRTLDEVVWGNESAMDAIGTCPVLSEGRYHRARIKVAAGWSGHIQGVDGIESRATGLR